MGSFSKKTDWSLLTGFYQFIFSVKTWLVAQSARDCKEKGQLIVGHKLRVLILSTANFVNIGFVFIAEQVSVNGLKEKDIKAHFLVNFSHTIQMRRYSGTII